VVQEILWEGMRGRRGEREKIRRIQKRGTGQLTWHTPWLAPLGFLRAGVEPQTSFFLYQCTYNAQSEYDFRSPGAL